MSYPALKVGFHYSNIDFTSFLILTILLTLVCDLNTALAKHWALMCTYSHMYYCRKIICTKVREGEQRLVRLKEGNPAGRHVVIVDDLVQTGGTLIECQRTVPSEEPSYPMTGKALQRVFTLRRLSAATAVFSLLLGEVKLAWCLRRRLLFFWLPLPLASDLTKDASVGFTVVGSRRFCEPPVRGMMELLVSLFFSLEVGAHGEPISASRATRQYGSSHGVPIWLTFWGPSLPPCTRSLAAASAFWCLPGSMAVRALTTSLATVAGLWFLCSSVLVVLFVG
eukprot:Gb_38970 [translate_table: standard]